MVAILAATTVKASTVFAPSTPYKAPEAPITRVVEKSGQEYIDELIDRKSAEFGVDPRLLKHIVRNESNYRRYIQGDTSYVCPRNGTISPSIGLVQISSCWHPEVSYAQATDPEFAISFLAREVAAGHCKQWSTCPA